LHPNWPDQVLLVRSHESFRIVSEQIKAALRRAVPMSQPARRFRRWMYAMGSHERYEESKLYPFLEARWGASMAELEAGHEALGAQRSVVEDAFARVDEVGDDAAAARARLREAFDLFDEILRDHLDLEERIVVPLLLELTPSEFADFTLLPIEMLLARLKS
jgi:hypothetical protein